MDFSELSPAAVRDAHLPAGDADVVAAAHAAEDAVAPDAARATDAETAQTDAEALLARPELFAHLLAEVEVLELDRPDLVRAFHDLHVLGHVAEDAGLRLQLGEHQVRTGLRQRDGEVAELVRQRDVLEVARAVVGHEEDLDVGDRLPEVVDRARDHRGQVFGRDGVRLRPLLVARRDGERKRHPHDGKETNLLGGHHVSLP